MYEVTLPHAILIPHGDAEMTLVSLGNEELAIDVRRPGEAAVKVHWSPYWRALGGCVERDGQWTRVIAKRPGALRMAIDFSPSGSSRTGAAAAEASKMACRSIRHALLLPRR